ncbi:TetR/AcrR family transcriptional regulator [Streptomyces sp. F63]|uniref:TetR/AcrR family transcriptional regulator n=1 Tax=Streptomyces sp. F63 TaxID=2824887 RepID=UPI001B3959AF|nr:TetR/AcrR family transcriptional regulator [Streptomyces sp. F63]MBQ0986594.1 TetR/AcrR family transcriptional regulator [Streptomyces sp. F63]
MTTEHSGSGDLSRSLELLWGADERRTRGPKPALSLDRIVTAAVAVADAEGLAAVSMRRIAGELGVGAMSLYRYVPGKAELLDLMLDKVNGFDREKAEDPALLGWRGTLEQVARGIWELYGRHPWLVHVDQARPLLGPGALAGLEHALGGLDGLPLEDPERVSLLVVVDGYVTGTARSRVNADLAEQRTGMSDEDFWRAQAPILERVMATGAYPKLAALSMEAFNTPWEEVFELGLRQLLDGMEAFIERRRRERDRGPSPDRGRGREGAGDSGGGSEDGPAGTAGR